MNRRWGVSDDLARDVIRARSKAITAGEIIGYRLVVVYGDEPTKQEFVVYESGASGWAIDGAYLNACLSSIVRRVG